MGEIWAQLRMLRRHLLERRGVTVIAAIGEGVPRAHRRVPRDNVGDIGPRRWAPTHLLAIGREQQRTDAFYHQPRQRRGSRAAVEPNDERHLVRSLGRWSGAPARLDDEIE